MWMWRPEDSEDHADEAQKSEASAAAKEVVAHYQRLRESKPHRLLHPSTDTESSLIERALAEGSPSEVLAYEEVPNTAEGDFFTTYATVERGDMMTLNPGQWLNDVVVNFYFVICLPLLAIGLRILDSRRRECHFFNSFFLQTMFDEYNDQDSSARGVYNYDKIKRWSRKFDPFEQEYIFCPYNYYNMHWGLAIIHVQTKTISWYDSMNKRRGGRLEGLRSYMRDEWNRRGYDSSRGPFNEDEWTFIVERVPQQENGERTLVRRCFGTDRLMRLTRSSINHLGYDCGVFVCMFAYFVLHGYPLVFDQDFITECRRKIVLAILRNQSGLSFVDGEAISASDLSNEDSAYLGGSYGEDYCYQDQACWNEDHDSGSAHDDDHTDRLQLATPQKSPQLKVIHEYESPPCSDTRREREWTSQLQSGNRFFSDSAKNQSAEDVFDISEATSQLKTALKKPVTLDSPIKQYVASSKSPDKLPYFQRLYQDENNQTRIDFKETPPTRVDITLDQLKQLLTLEHGLEGELCQPDFVPQSGKSRYWKSHWLLDLIAEKRPKHFCPSVKHFKPFKWGVDGKTKGVRGGKDKGHDFDAIYIDGVCAAKKHGCNNSFYGGLKKADVEDLFHGRVATIPLELYYRSNCCNHMKGYNYLRFTGSARANYVSAVVKGKKQARPKQLVEDGLGGEFRFHFNGCVLPTTLNPILLHPTVSPAMTADDYALKNTHGVPARVTQVYEANRDSKKQLAKVYGLGNNTLANTIHATYKIREQDARRRLTMDEHDKSTDCLGVLQSSSFHDGLTCHLFTKDQMKLMAGLMKLKRLVLYYDSTGGLVKLSREACGTTKHLLHSVLSFCPSEMFLTLEEFQFRDNLFHAVPFAEHISHNQSNETHRLFADQILNACHSIDPESGTPLLVNTDGDGALQNGWIEACANFREMVYNRITWCNIVTLVMLWLEYEDANGYGAHFYRAVKDWIMSDERPRLANLKHLQNMFKRLAVEISQCPSLSLTMTMLCSAIVIVETEYIEVDKFSLYSRTQEGPDEDAMKLIASSMETLLCQSSHGLHIPSPTELKQRLNETMKVKDSRGEKFMGSQLCSSVKASLKASMKFAHAYLFSKDERTGCGVIRIHIIYGFHRESELVKPVSAGYFEAKVDLRNFDGKVPNPFFFPKGGEYLDRWLRESAIWARVFDMHIFGNNQHAEGVIKYLKEQPDLNLHTKELATYQWWWYNNTIKGMRKLVYDYDTAAFHLKRRAWRKQVREQVASGDVLSNDAINEDQIRWNVRGYDGRNGEEQLRSQIKELFDRALEDIRTDGRTDGRLTSIRDSVSLRFKTISVFSEKTGDGTMSRFGYTTFLKWYNGVWSRPKSGIPKAAVAAMAAFCTEVSMGSTETFKDALVEATKIKNNSIAGKKGKKTNK